MTISKNTIFTFLLSFFIIYPQFGSLLGLYGIPLYFPNATNFALCIVTLFLTMIFYKDILNQHVAAMFVISFFILTSSISIYYLCDSTFVPYLETSYIMQNFVVNTGMFLLSLLIISNYKLCIDLIIKNKKNIFIIYTLITLLFFYSLFKFTSSIQFALTFGMIFEDEKLASIGFHLFFSYWYALFAIMLLLLYKDTPIKNFVIGLISLYVLYLAGGRGSFVAFGLVFFLMQSIKVKVFSIVFSIIAIFYFLSTVGNETLSYEQTRYVNLLNFEFTKDASYNDRLKQLNLNFESIEQNLFTGWFKSHIVLIDNGKYIHNFFSILQDYGITSFLSLTIFMGLASISILFPEERSFMYFSSYYLFVYSSIEIILFKTVQQFDILVIVFITGYYLITNSRLYLFQHRLNNENQ